MENERVRILYEIELLKKQTCEKCQNKQSKISRVNCKCKAAVKIRELGDRLMNLVNDRSWQGLLDEIKERRRMTVKQYMTLRRYEESDEELLKILGVGEVTFRRWKNRNGLSNLHLKSKEEINLILKERGNIEFFATKRRIKYTEEDIDYALSLVGKMTYKEIEKVTGVSSGALSYRRRARENAKRCD